MRKFYILSIFVTLSLLVFFLTGCVLGLAEDGVDLGIDGAEAAVISTAGL